jgi:hypothetical protein
MGRSNRPWREHAKSHMTESMRGLELQIESALSALQTASGVERSRALGLPNPLMKTVN